MTSTPTSVPTTGASGPVTAQPSARRAVRDLDSPVLGGVAAGLARHLRVPVLWLRVVFVVTTVTGALGVVLYAAFWILLPAGTGFERAAPGLESATRSGRRPGRRRRGLNDLGPVVVLAALGIGAVLTVEAVVGRAAVFWPLAIAVVGVALLWRQADEVQRERLLDAGGRVGPLQVVFGAGGWASYARVAAGVALLLAALFVLGFGGGSLQQASGTLVAGGLGILGIAIVVGPWVWHLVAELSEERAQRVRTEERADVAAHLHDSVLQTLALIQRNADDATVVARLARSQERDLRSWLYAGESTDEATLASALRGAAAVVEDDHGVGVDVVTVGDVDLDDTVRPVVAAARESMVNAAKHAGVPRVDVYAEVSSEAVEVFVRDRGRGFSPDDVPGDRYGVRHSIVDRMRRHGGSGEVRSTPGSGTEVRLHLSRPSSDQSFSDQASELQGEP